MRPDINWWLKSKSGPYLYDKQKPTLATWQPYQVDILGHLFPEGDGILPYNRILWSEPKKSGKTELAAALHLFFGLFVDVPGEQYVLANDLMGASTRTFQYIVSSLEKAAQVPGSKIKTQDFSRTGSKLVLSNGTVIRAIPADPRGEAGANHSFASIDEPWGINYEYQGKLMTEFGPVPTRPMSTVLFTGYQGVEGQSDFWHNLIDGVLQMGKPVPELIHIDNGDGQPACWSFGRTFLFFSHLPRQPWHTPEYLADERHNYRGRMSEYLRVWENRRVKGADAFVTAEKWDELLDPALRALGTGDTRRVVLGADAATKSDSCALEGVTWNAATRKIESVFSRVWVPEDGHPIKLTETLGPEIVRLHQTHQIAAVYYDPYQMAAIAEMCTRAGVNMVEFPQTARRVQSDKHLHDLLWGNNFAHYGDPVLGEHVQNAMVKESERGIRIVKELSSRKVDAAVALSMAALGAIEMLAEAEGKLQSGENPFFSPMDMEAS